MNTRKTYGALFRAQGYKPKAAPPLICFDIKTYKSSSGAEFTLRAALSGGHRVESWNDSKLEEPTNKYVVNMARDGLHRSYCLEWF